MEFKEIASIAGKSGLYRLLKPTKAGVIVETLDEKKLKMVVGTTHRVSLLNDISIYTTPQDGSVPLREVMQAAFAKYGASLPVDAMASSSALGRFLGEVLPDFDRDRVHTSDIKKFVSWYSILTGQAPVLLEKSEEVPATTEASDKKSKKIAKAQTPETESSGAPAEEKSVKAPKKAKAPAAEAETGTPKVTSRKSKKDTQ